MKNKKTAKEKIIAGIILVLALGMPVAFLAASTNPNYGTTTFFSNQKEKPVLEKPILGAEDPSNSSDGNHNKDNNNDDNHKGIVNPDDIFNAIGSTIGAVVDNSVNALSETKKSLFDFQSEFFGSGDSSGDGTFNQQDQFIVSGPKGESLEYLATLNQDGAAHAVEFNFNDASLKAAPKKSKLLFTNIEIATDMTSQYVVIVFIFVMAIGLAVGYYFWKKGATDNKEEDYD